MKSWPAIITLASLLSFGSGQSRAEKIEIAYSWTLSQQAISAPGGNQIVPVYQSSGTVFAPVENTLTTAIPGIQWNASSPPNTWPTADFNATVNARLVLTDVASGQSTHIDYREKFELIGTGVWHDLYATESLGRTPPPLRLGNYIYQLYPNGDLQVTSLGSSYSPSLPAPASIGLIVDGIGPVVSVSYAPGVPTPEPSTLALGGIAALGLTLTRRGRAWVKCLLCPSSRP